MSLFGPFPLDHIIRHAEIDDLPRWPCISSNTVFIWLNATTANTIGLRWSTGMGLFLQVSGTFVVSDIQSNVKPMSQNGNATTEQDTKPIQYLQNFYSISAKLSV
ncbi:MAG: hypothetical protein SFY92_06150 [Verrucomicrobiae bacterium]|nr:hypothetical protein [Verrucomicrobiae bacterium]